MCNSPISRRVQWFDKTRTAEIISGLAIMLASHMSRTFNPIIASVYEIRHGNIVTCYVSTLCTHKDARNEIDR